MSKLDFMIRQGDVLVRAVKAIPAAVDRVAPDQGRVVLAYGEVTGHAHAITANRAVMFRETGSLPGGRRFLEIAGDGAELVHDEHSTIALPEGAHEIVQQREYTPEAIRDVAD